MYPIFSLLTPATVCLAIPLYEQLHILKHNWRAILGGILAGVFANAIGIWILSKLFRLTHIEYVTLLPKSVTTAIGMAISQELGGVAAITVAARMLDVPRPLPAGMAESNVSSTPLPNDSN